MNKLIITGNVTNAPETRATTSGMTVCSFTVAVNRKFKNADGDRVSDFYRVSAWRQLGEVCAKYVQKGSKVSVIGELQPRLYEGKDGKTRLSLDVSADEVEFLSEKKKEPEKPVSEWDDISSDDLPWRK